MLLTCADVAKYFVWLANNDFAKISDFSPMKLQKITYIAQGWYLALYDEPLFSEDFEAWTYGPVNESLYKEYRHFGKNRINVFFERPELPFEIERFLNKIANSFFHIDANKLSGMTHKEDSPWKITRRDLSSKDSCNEVISKDLIKDYYQVLIDDSEDNESEDAVLGEFLDFLISDADLNFHNMIPYTEDMQKLDAYLVQGVI